MNRRDLLKTAALIPFTPFIKLDIKSKRDVLPKFRVPDFSPPTISFYRLLAKNHGTAITHDFSKALGDTIMEKYESLYLDIVRVCVLVHRRVNNLPQPKNDGEFWDHWRQMSPGYTVSYAESACNFIITTPIIATVFQTATCGWNGPYDYQDSKDPIRYLGTINSRWKVYTSSCLQPWDIVLGCTDERGFVKISKENWGYIKMVNFII